MTTPSRTVLLTVIPMTFRRMKVAANVNGIPALVINAIREPRKIQVTNNTQSSPIAALPCISASALARTDGLVVDQEELDPGTCAQGIAPFDVGLQTADEFDDVRILFLRHREHRGGTPVEGDEFLVLGLGERDAASAPSSTTPWAVTIGRRASVSGSACVPLIRTSQRPRPSPGRRRRCRESRHAPYRRGRQP